ncbi:hypothetical protein KR222_009533 [Zaprionus bogoriensis]|nr:hypothetical protein KR222_009533 [Zaprionus bogoriensis]
MENENDYSNGGYHAVAIGDCFAERYYALDKLGWGHYSTVWLCYDAREERYCAVKIIRSSIVFTHAAQQEVQLLHHLAKFASHPLRERVVSMRNDFQLNGSNGLHPCIVFDCLGENMLTLIQRSGYQGLPLHNVKQIAAQVLQGLQLLHEQARLIHTDLKPENVLLVSDDLTFRMRANAATRKYLRERELEREREQEQEREREREQERQRQQQLQHSQEQQQQQQQQEPQQEQQQLLHSREQTTHFIQSHRKWLRARGLEDLLLLATHGLLTRQMALEAVTGQLPWLPYDGPQILSEQDQLELARHEQLQQQPEQQQQPAELAGEQVGDAAMEEPALGKRKPRKRSRGRRDSSSRKALKLLRGAHMERFVRHVMKCVEREEQQRDGQPHHSARKRSRCTRSARRAARAHQQQQQQQEQLQQQQQQQPETIARSPNLSLLSRKDPALEACALQVAIADVGNSCFIDNHEADEIQTREYRAVEVILGAEYGPPADLWSAACLFWELATGEYLFETKKEDEVHVAHIIETCGNIPMHLIERGECSGNLFDAHGQLLHVHELQVRHLDRVLVDRYGWAPRAAREFTDFLMPMLVVDPACRITAANALKDPWLQLP